MGRPRFGSACNELHALPLLQHVHDDHGDVVLEVVAGMAVEMGREAEDELLAAEVAPLGERLFDGAGVSLGAAQGHLGPVGEEHQAIAPA